MWMPCPRFSPGEGSKQSQVSALPERRVKKQRSTALMGYMSILRMLFFCCGNIAGNKHRQTALRASQYFGSLTAILCARMRIFRRFLNI